MSDDDNGVPNLDCVFPAELWEFHAKHKRGRAYRDLFPAGGKGTKKATEDLANYAANKATAMQCRERGQVDSALIYEGIADRIYESLPAWAKW